MMPVRTSGNTHGTDGARAAIVHDVQHDRTVLLLSR